MVVAVLYVVEHAQFLQVLAALQGSVSDYYLQVAERVLAASVGLPELYCFQCLAAVEGVLADGHGLVVIVRAGVVVDAHHAVVLVQIVGVGTYNLGIPDVLLVLLCQQAATDKVLIVGRPVAQGVHHRLMAGGIVLHRVALAVAHIAVLGTVDAHVLLGLHVEADHVLLCLPGLAGQVVLIDRGVNHYAAVGGAAEGVGSHLDGGGGRHDVPLVGTRAVVVHHDELRQVGTVGKGLLANDEVGGVDGLEEVVAIVALEGYLFQVLTALEGSRRDDCQMGTVPGTRYAVVGQYGAGEGCVPYPVTFHILVDVALVAHGGGDIEFVAVLVVADEVFLVVEAPALLPAEFVAEVELVVAARQVSVFHALDSMHGARLGHRGGYLDHRRIVDVAQLVAPVLRPGVADVESVLGIRVAPVVEGHVVRSRQLNPGAAGPVVHAVEAHERLVQYLVGTARWHVYSAEDHRTLLVVERGLYHLRRVAVGEVELGTSGHAGKGGTAIDADGLGGVNHRVADGDVHVRPTHHAGTVAAVDHA